MAECSLLVISGVPPKRLHGFETEIGERSGIKFIKLLHNTGPGTGEKQLRGFQGARIVESEAENGKVTRAFEFSRDKNGNDRSIARNLIFFKEQDTGDLVAYVPDTKFNRKRLQTMYAPGSEWKITDKSVAEELRAEYDKSAKEIAKNDTQAEIIARLAEENAKAKEEIERLKKENSQSVKRDSIVTNAKKIAKIREKIEAEVKEEKAEFIASLKLQGGNYWFKQEYKEAVTDEIDRRVKEKLNADSSEHSNDDN